MLFHRDTLAGIRSGTVTLAFRRWTKPAAKEGGTQKTQIGVVRISDIRKVSYVGDDPRIALREQTLTDDDMQSLTKKLERFDTLSSQGPWTDKVFALIREHPHRRAPDLAAMAGWDTQWMKLNVRKLKALGLTISHEVGYELSPRARDLLTRLGK